MKKHKNAQSIKTCLFSCLSHVKGKQSNSTTCNNDTYSCVTQHNSIEIKIHALHLMGEQEPFNERK